MIPSAASSAGTIQHSSLAQCADRLLSGGAVDGDALTIGRVKGAEYVFESISQTNQVIVYKHRSEKPYTTLATASANVEGLALKPAGIP